MTLLVRAGAQPPEGWKAEPLGSRFDVQLGKMLNPHAVDEQSGLHAPYLTNAHVQWNRVDLSGLPTMVFNARDRVRFELRVDDLLVCEGGDIGRCAIWVSSRTDVYFQKAILRLRALSASDSSAFLKYVISAATQRGEFASSTNKTTIPHLPASTLRRTRVLWPPTVVQRRIADFLDARCAVIDAAIEKKERLVEVERGRRESLIDGRLRDFATKYPLLPLRRHLQWIEQGWSPQCDSRTADPQEWGVLKVGCVNGGLFDPAENKALPAHLAPLTEYQVHEGDLLVSRANTRELVGSAALIPSIRQRLLLCDKLFRLHVAADQLDKHYLALVLRSPFVRSHIESDATGASDSMKNIGQDTIRSILISVPPLETQQQFAAEFRESDRRHHCLTAALTRSIAALREYRTALITAAVTGQLPLDAPSPSEAAL